MRMRFVGTLLRPSLFSFITGLLSSALILSLASWTSFVNSGALYTLLFGSNASIGLINSSQTWWSQATSTVFNNGLLNRTLLFVFWMFIGLVVYIGWVGFSYIVIEVDHTLHEVHYVNNRPDEFVKGLGSRLSLRAAAACAWFLYIVFFFKLLLPFSTLSFRIGTSTLSTLQGIGYSVLGFVALVISIHLHAVFMRLVLLRPRVFGGWEDVLHEELEK